MVTALGGAYRIDLHLVSGNRKAGTWAGTVPILRCTATTGSWAPFRAAVRDAAGRLTNYSSANLSPWPTVHVTGRDLTVDFPVVTATGPADDVTLSFDEPVNGITADSAILAGSEILTGSWTCLDFAGGAEDCLTGRVRKAVFNPDADLVSGEDYAFILDPPGQLALTDLAGNPFTRFHLPFFLP